MSDQSLLEALDRLRVDLVAGTRQKNECSDENTTELARCGDGYRLVLIPPPHVIKPGPCCSCEKVTDQLQCQITELNKKIATLTTEVATIKKAPIDVDSAKIGRWRFKTGSDGSLIIKDTHCEGKRYKFPAGGKADMYKDGLNGEICARQITFPTRWSIGEESVSYLVFRDRGVPGRDFRYAMAANRYVDI